MDILVINSGSSSLKFQLVDMDDEHIIAQGLCERIGGDGSTFTYGRDNNEVTMTVPLPDADSAVSAVLSYLTEGPHHPIDSLDEIDAVGHRVVHGGAYFDESVIIDDDVVARIDELAELAPLHNRAALAGIVACRSRMPLVPQAAVFDTSFFQTLAPASYVYPLPLEYLEKHGIRRYGAHGTSHRYISQRAAALVGEPLDELRIITCHLGNGCSMTAVDHGKAIDTSMGFTPLDGLMMGTRCGAIDPAIVPFLMDHEGLDTEGVNDVMNKKSGLLGISGLSNDLRTIGEAADKGDERAALAYEMYAYSVKKYIGQYTVEMAGVDVIVLAAGIGENDAKMRRMIFAGMQPMGIILDEEKNRQRGFERIISSGRSKVKIVVIPTKEEFMIALDTYRLVHERSQMVLVGHGGE